MPKPTRPEGDAPEALPPEHEIQRLRQYLKGIASLGGNLPDDRLTNATGSQDAAARGLMYVTARQMANLALGKPAAAQGGGADRAYGGKEGPRRVMTEPWGTPRDLLAREAMRSLCQNQLVIPFKGGSYDWSDLARWCYRLADAMLAERDKAHQADSKGGA